MTEKIVYNPQILLENEFDLSRAYIKKEVVGKEDVWSIYSESGERMGYANTREMALSLAAQNELNTSSVH